MRAEGRSAASYELGGTVASASLNFFNPADLKLWHRLF
jgi:hypothetical protein